MLDAAVFVPFQKSVAESTERVVALIDREVRSKGRVHPDAIQTIIHDAVKPMPGDVAVIAVHIGYDRLDRWRDASAAVSNRGALFTILDKLMHRKDLDDEVREQRIRTLLRDMRHVGVTHEGRPGSFCHLMDGCDVTLIEHRGGEVEFTVHPISGEAGYSMVLFNRCEA